jgi:hypothetical protein
MDGCVQGVLIVGEVLSRRKSVLSIAHITITNKSVRYKVQEGELVTLEHNFNVKSIDEKAE